MKHEKTQDEPPAPAGDNTNTDETADAAALQAETEQLRAEIRFGAARDSVLEELKRAGARSPRLLFESVKGDLEFDDEGKPANTAAIVGRLKTAFPEQFGSDAPQSIDGGAGVVRKPSLTREALKRMKPAEIAELDWSEVKRVLATWENETTNSE
jgi:hypothetical protein